MLHLALAFGMGPKRLGRELDSREVAEYIALQRVDPWGPVRSDIQAATAAFGAASVWSDKIRLENFVIPYGETEEERKARQNADFLNRLKAHQVSTQQFQ